MFELIGIGFVIWVVWKVIKAIARTATTQAYHQGAAESLDLQSAQKQYEAAEDDFIASVFAGGTTAAQQQSLLDKAVFLKDRINQLTGSETGSVFRARFRNELVSKANNVGSSLEATFQAMQAQNVGGSESDEDRDVDGHGFDSFEEWLVHFKLGAGDANEQLAEKTDDDTCLIDLMELSPLRRAFAEGVEPYELGVQFGEQFDIGEFLARAQRG